MTFDQWKLGNPDDEAAEQQRRMGPDADDEADRLWQAWKEGDLHRPDIDRRKLK